MLGFILVFFLITASFSVRKAVLSSVSVQNSVRLPILMYHHFLPERDMLGKYVISPSEFENDLKFLIQNGYTTVSVSDLEAFIQGKGNLPSKPIMITVDDGYLSFYKYAFPLLKKYNCKAVFSVVGYYSEYYESINQSNVIYTHVTFNQMKEMLSSSLIEIANHSYNMHDLKKRHGIKRLEGESEEQYKSILTKDILKNQELLFSKISYVPYIYTYPFGYRSEFTDNLIRELGFKASFTCEERINTIARGSSLFNLHRYNRSSGKNIFKMIQ